jgi:hypothetical protein
MGTWFYLELYSQGGLIPIDMEIDEQDINYLTKTYSPAVKDNNKRVYRINKEDLLKNDSVSDNLIGKLNECRGDILVLEIWDDKYE